MKRFFNLENPVWRFVGNLADLFLLSVYWYVCCLPVFTIGSGTTALYYVTLKLVQNQEGYTTASFWRSFRSNFKQATLLWLGCLGVGAVIGIDIYWGLMGGSSFGASVLPAFLIMAFLFLMVVSFLFPLLARCDNTSGAIVKMCCAMVVRNFLPVFSALLVTAGLFLLGIFVLWPVLLIAPGLSAYLNSYLFNRILEKYGLGLPDIGEDFT